ncbi:NACHT, LRR and PYD domains-containing protein 5-like isoform X2 [Clavelina lepadiformis]|uniref:NACHT, LRR and PYD domains-containing protein 5-like isoform X2 n=1 Tax=Clavelina lepadiformis TaxID=159417 RepID=UPI00404311B7
MEQNNQRTFTTESSSCGTIAESNIVRSNVIQHVKGGVNISQTTINQQAQPSTSQASQPQSSDRKNHSKSISKNRIRAGNLVTNFFHGMFPFILISNLEKTLKEHARVVCGEIIHPIKLDLAINTVKLELSQRVPNMPSDDEGHYNKRDEVVKAWESVKGNIELKDLFALAQNSAEKEAERLGTQEAKQDYINKNKNTVFVIGQAGMGKTTLAKTITNLVTEEQLLPECKFLFYIPFRAVDFSIESNFLDFVLRCFQSEWPHNVELDFVLLKHLSNDPNVLFIFDGLDEANTDYFFSKNTSLTCDLCDNYTPDIFIANILSGKIFANAKKLLTSRPRQFFELNKAYLSGCVVNILGLSVKSQAKLCQQICKEKYDSVQNYLSRNPLIDASCYVPAKCIIIYGVLSDSFNSSLDHGIQSLTDIFVRALYYYSKSEQHVRKPEELQKLCHLAWNRFQARKIIFTESDISNVKISSETLETFLTTSTKIDNLQVNHLQGEKQSSFSHLIWHELFTAIHLILNVLSGDFQNHLSFFLESRWEVVASFVFGLCNRSVQRNLNLIFKIAVVDFDEKFEQLDNFVCKEMANLRKSFQTSTFIEICNWIYQLNNRKMAEKVAAFVPEQILLDGKVHLTDLCSVCYLLQYAQSGFSVRFGQSLSFTYNAIYRWLFQVSNKSNEVFCQNLIRELLKSAARQPDSSADNLLHACRWLYEKSGDSNPKEMVQYFPQLVVLTKPPSFDQITHLMYLIVQSTSSFKVHIKCNSPTIQIDGSLDPDEVITLVAFLHLVQRPWQLQMNENKIISPTKVGHLLQVMMDTINKNSCQKVQIKFSAEEQSLECDLSGCGISSQGTQMLAFFLLRLPYRIDRLNLSGIEFGDAGIPFIMSCLDKIDKLYMTDCNITEEGVRVITEHIKICSNLPKVLEFNYDKMNRSKVLRCGLDQLDNGNFRHLHLTPVGWEALATAINKLPQPMKRLNLSFNNLGDDGASHISTCHTKIEELHISKCKISAFGIKSISDAISKLPEPMKKLDLHNNDLGDDGASHISTCLSKIEELDIGYCKISASGIKSISDAISKLPEPMKKLRLSGNDLGDDGASHISTCLSKIEELYIGECKIRASGIKSISDAISKLPEPMKKLVLYNNNLGDDGASHISTCLSKIRKLHIRQCKIRASGIKSISDAISKLPEPMKKLNLWGNNLGDDGASHISTCLSKIEELHISECKIRASGIKSISDAISKLPEPMKKLVLFGNNLGDYGASHISTCLSKIEELEISWCNISASGIKSISDAISMLLEPMERAYLAWQSVSREYQDDKAALRTHFCAIIITFSLINLK